MDENRHPYTKLFVCGLIIVLVAMFIITALVVIETIEQSDDKPSPYDKTCQKLRSLIKQHPKEYSGGLNQSECVQYFEANSNSTGQDVFEHFEIKTRDQLLTETIVVPNND